MKRLKIFLLLICSLFISSYVFALTKPSVSNGLLGTTNGYMTTSPNFDASIQAQYPTNQWWSWYAFNNNNNRPIVLGNVVFRDTTFYYFSISPVDAEVSNSGKDFVQKGIDSSSYLRLGFWWKGNDGNNYNSYDHKSDSCTIKQRKIIEYSDFMVKIQYTYELKNASKPDAEITVTLVKGSPFIVFHYSPNIEPYHINGNQDYGSVNSLKNDTFRARSWGDKIYAYFTPENFTVYNANEDWGYRRRLEFPATTTKMEDRYLVVARAESDEEALLLRKYAFNFITDTKAVYTVNNKQQVETTYKFTFTPKRTGSDFVTDKTLMLLYPHQWRYLKTGTATDKTTSSLGSYKTLRGTLKIYEGTKIDTNTNVSGFITKYDFDGILPALSNEISADKMNEIKGLIDLDKNFEITGLNRTTYRRGKGVAKLANMLPVLVQVDSSQAVTVRKDLEQELTDWFNNGKSGFDTGTKYFSYDTTYGGIIGFPYKQTPGDNFGYEYYNDHHFHHGYFVYASAILAMFDKDFKNKYKDYVNLLVRDFAEWKRNNGYFPYLRNFDIYEGHSWANGRAGYNEADNNSGYNGNDQESISEAINAWAGIYLWGVATNQKDLMDLGMYGYTTEVKASEEYYFDVHNDIRKPGTDVENFPHGGVVYDNALKHMANWTGHKEDDIYGIWLLPLSAGMLYLGNYYDEGIYQSSKETAYKNFYTEMMGKAENGTNRNAPLQWRHIWLRYKSMYNASDALGDWNTRKEPYDDSSAGGHQIAEDASYVFTYHWLHFFNALGRINGEYYATNSDNKSVPFTVMEKNGKKAYLAYNPSDDPDTITFYKKDGSKAGEVDIPGRTLARIIEFDKNQLQTQKFDAREFYITDNAQNLDVYGIFSETYPKGVSFDSDEQDRVKLMIYEKASQWWGGAEVDFLKNAETNISTESAEGYNCFRFTFDDSNVGGIGGGWGILFSKSATAEFQPQEVDMSRFTGGTCEVYIKHSPKFPYYTAPGNKKKLINIEVNGYKYDINTSGDIYGEWKKVSIPLKGSINEYHKVKTLFAFTVDGYNYNYTINDPIYVDNIVWKSSGVPTTLSITTRYYDDKQVTPKNLEKKYGGFSSYDTWTKDINFPLDVNLYKNNTIHSAKTYLDIILDEGSSEEEQRGYSVLVYTDNKQEMETIGRDGVNKKFSFTGTFTNGYSGLVDIYNTNTLIPLYWTLNGSYNNKTIDTGTPSDIYRILDNSYSTKNAEGKIVMTSKGIPKTGHEWGVYRYDDLTGMSISEIKRVKLYFLADYSRLANPDNRNTAYSTKIYIELLKE